MHKFIEQNSPPGYAVPSERRAILIALTVSVVLSLFSYISAFSQEKSRLYDRIGEELILNRSRVMADFVDILGSKLHALLILALLILVITPAIRYAYHLSGSKSIYVMRRLPNRWELPRRCLLLPVLAALLFLLVAALLLLLYYVAYMSLTPDACLQPGQWAKIWRV